MEMPPRVLESTVLFCDHQIPVVRVHAVLAVEYLQTGGPDCAVTSALLEMHSRVAQINAFLCYRYDVCGAHYKGAERARGKVLLVTSEC